MNLEAIEQRTLRYLKQTRNPLTPFEQLADHLRREEDLGDFTDPELLAFLRDHELFEVLEPPQLQNDEVSEQDLAEYGLQMKPHVILTTRVPTQRQMAQQMAAQLQGILEALNHALADARDKSEPEKAKMLIRLQDRAKQLRERLAKFV